MKSKTTAGLLALFLGGIGAHKFYLDRAGQGILYLLFAWTFIPAIIGLLEGIGYLVTSEEDFDRRYNASFTQQPSQPVVVNVQNAATAHTGTSLTQQLKELAELKESGVLSESEFQEQKQKMLQAGA